MGVDTAVSLWWRTGAPANSRRLANARNTRGSVFTPFLQQFLAPKMGVAATTLTHPTIGMAVRRRWPLFAAL